MGKIRQITYDIVGGDGKKTYATKVYYTKEEAEQGIEEMLDERFKRTIERETEKLAEKKRKYLKYGTE